MLFSISTLPLLWSTEGSVGQVHAEGLFLKTVFLEDRVLCDVASHQEMNNLGYAGLARPVARLSFCRSRRLLCKHDIETIVKLESLEC